MSERTRGLVLIVVGVLLALIGLAADVLGLGGHPGIGWKQILGMLIGVGVVVIGLRDVGH
jgi:hypothetical protein